MNAAILFIMALVAAAVPTTTPTSTPSCGSAAERAACPYCCDPTPVLGSGNICKQVAACATPSASATATTTPTPTRSATPTATPTMTIPLPCTHQAAVEFASQFSDGVNPAVANCPGFAATRLGLPVFTTLQPSDGTKELAFDNSVSQGHNGQVDYFGVIKFTNPTTDRPTTITVTTYIGPTAANPITHLPCDWTDPADCGGLYSETTKWQIAPGQTSSIPFHEFIPATWPTVEYFFLTASTDGLLLDCGVQYQSSECGGTAN